jgi:hypothetical protein
MPSPGHEDALLLVAAHPVASPERAQRIAALLACDLQWPRVVADAERHGVAAMVDHHLFALGEDRVPPAARDALARAARRCVAWNLLLRRELARLLDALDRASLAVMPLKGPVLADALYPDPLLRHTTDLDLLLREAEAVPAEEALRGLGYRRLPESEQGTGYHTCFVSDRGEAAHAVIVELHHELGERHVSRPDTRPIWASASPGAWQGKPIWRMALADLVVYLCFHAAKDGLGSLRTLLDLALLVERHRDAIAWEDVVIRARAAHLSAPVHLALGESRALLGAPVPDAVLDRLRPRRLRGRLGRMLFRWRGGVLHAPEELLVGPVMAALMMLWDDAPGATRRHLRRNLLPSAPLRDRWTQTGPAASWMRWYPVWLWRAARAGGRQVAVRARGIRCC